MDLSAKNCPNSVRAGIYGYCRFIFSKIVLVRSISIDGRDSNRVVNDISQFSLANSHLNLDTASVQKRPFKTSATSQLLQPAW